MDQRYCTGEEIHIGDVVRFAGHPATVAFVIDRAEYSAEFLPSDYWSSFGSGFMLQTAAFGLVLESEADEDLEFVSRAPVHSMKRGADCLAWSLQFVVGLPVGALIGFAIISRGRRIGGGWWITSEDVPLFLWGAALIGAGLASFYGDRLWLSSSYRVIPPDGVEHSDTSRIVSIVTGVLGSILVLTAILRHFGVF